VMKDQSKSFSVKKILILVIILAFPGFCYYLLQEKGKNRYKPLPFYGEKKLTGTFHSRRGKQIPDTLYHIIEPFSMTNSDGRPVIFGPDSGVAVVSLFYIGNKGLSVPVNAAMEKIAERFSRNEMVRLYSLTIDPTADTPQQLKLYKEKWGDYDRWNFLTGDSREDVAEIARNEFLLDVVYDPKAEPTFVYSSSIVLLDSQRRIRGYYNALLAEDVDRLTDEIKLLLTEEFRNISVSEGNE